MAELVPPYDGLPEYDRDAYEDYRQYSEAEKEAFEQLQSEQPMKPEAGLEGFLLKFQVADGYAWYRVVNEDPLKIQHVPYLDGYKSRKETIRGIRRDTVIEQMERRRKMRDLRS